MAYFACRPTPTTMPSTIAHSHDRVAVICQSAQSAIAQRGSSRTSVETMAEESQIAGMNSQPTPAQNPAQAPYIIRPSANNAHAATACAIGETRRTAHSASVPNRLVVAAMAQAISGGLEKYPQAGVCDHAQYWASS